MPAIDGAVGRVDRDATAVGDRDPGFELAYGNRVRRLRALEDVHEPDNFFRMNADIAPSSPGADTRGGTEWPTDTT